MMLRLPCSLGITLLLFISGHTLAETIVNVGEIREFHGPDDLDLDPARVVVAIDVFGDTDRTVNGVLFQTDQSPPANVSVNATHSINGWASLPDYTGEDPTSTTNLELIMQDIRWSQAPAGLSFEVGGLSPGVEYELQMLFNEGRSNDRRWDIGIEGELAVDDFSSEGNGSWDNRTGVAYLAPFHLTPGDTTLNVELRQDLGGQAARGSDNNPILQAFTVTEVTIPPSPDSLDLSPGEFFANQTEAIGSLTTIDLKRNADHLYSLNGNGADNDKFQIANHQLLPDPLYDFSLHPHGTTFTIGVRTTDAEDPTRFLDETFSLTLAPPRMPTQVNLGATSLSSGSIPGTPAGSLSTEDPNPVDGHFYELVAGDGDTHNGLFIIDGDTLEVSKPIPAELPAVSIRIRTTDRSGLFVEQVIVLPVTEPSLRLNELMASNGGSLLDQDNEASDWIEIFNEQAGSANLNGWHLTDDLDDLDQWTFPAITIGPNDFLLVFASGRDRRPDDGGELHTNFQLSARGESVYLVRPDGETVAGRLEFPESFPDVSFGLDGTTHQPGFLQSPTPAEANGNIAAKVRNEVTFSRERGLYEDTFQLALSAGIPGSTIRYTQNGQKPTASSGTIYTGPITVSPETGGSSRGTRLIRAIAIHPSAALSPVSTHTYLWVRGVDDARSDGILGQSVFQSAITNHPDYGPEMDDGLLALPVVSIVKPGNVTASEEEMSMELISNDGSEAGFQIDAGIKIVGGASTGSPKNNWRLYFRGEYGATKLRYPVFAREPYSNHTDNEDFDLLQLRGGSHDNFFWMALPTNQSNGAYRPGDALYTRNRWISDMEMLMGHPSLHGRYVHCYLNGTYHGLYHLHERPMHHYLDKYFGGEATDYHYTNSGRTGSDHGGGDRWAETWNEVKAAASAGGESSREWINWESLADNQLLYYYCGNDWDWTTQHNWMAAGPKDPGRGGWRFYSWDCDVMLYDVNSNNLDQNAPDGVFRAMMRDRDFQVYFRDRIFKHCFHEGLLAPGGPTPSFEYRMNEISSALVPETARWQPRSADRLPWDRDGEWRDEWNYVTETYFTRRTDILLNQFRATGWYPVEAPEFEPRGGEVAPGFSPALSSASGTVYLTTDGSDPRLPGGAVNPESVAVEGGEVARALIARESVWSYLDDGSDQGSAWRGPEFDDSTWSTGVAELGYGDGPEGAEGTLVDFGGDLATKFITTYFRKNFDVTEPAQITGLALGLRRDDGAVVYLNGTEVWRSGMPVTGPVTHTTLATNGSGGTDESIFHRRDNLPLNLLREGRNTLAVEVHQNSPTSSDISFDLELLATRPSDPSPLVLDQSSWVRARVLSGNEWSPVNSARFFVGDSASSANLVVSELHYRPVPPTEQEDPGGLYSRTDFEFIEFRNISANPIHLDGVRLVDGIEFDFSEASIFGIPPGESLVLVENLEAFRIRYPGVPLSKIAGQYRSNLSNGGERIAILDRDHELIKAFSYDDQPPWPLGADGDGFSLELLNPDSNPSHHLGNNWQESRGLHGTPGGFISPVTFEEWKEQLFTPNELLDPAISGPTVDPDGDGWNNLTEFVLGLPPKDPVTSSPPIRGLIRAIDGENYLALEFEHWPGALDATISMQVSDDLEDWHDDFIEVTRAMPRPDGMVLRTFRATSPMTATPGIFARLVISLN